MAGLWLVVGAGRCGLHLLRAMIAAGVETGGVVLRSERSSRRVGDLLPAVPRWWLGERLPPADALLLAVPDAAVAGCAATLAGAPGRLPPLALHTSGVLPAAALAPLGGRGCCLGSFHPLLSFPPAEAAGVDLAGVFAAVEGDEAAVGAARELAAALGMRAWRVEAAAKPRYHAAAALAANLAPALVTLAREELVAAGMPPELAAAGLAPLASRSVASALEAAGWERLTGALVRGDAATVEAHVGALSAEVAPAYAAVARVIVARLAAAGHLDRPAARRLLAALTAKP